MFQILGISLVMRIEFGHNGCILSWHNDAFLPFLTQYNLENLNPKCLKKIQRKACGPGCGLKKFGVSGKRDAFMMLQG